MATTNPVALVAQSFKKELDDFAADPRLKLSEGATSEDAALRLQEVRRSFAYAIGGIAHIFADLQAQWLSGTPLPPDEVNPLPAVVNPSAEQLRIISEWEKRDFKQFTQRELLRHAVKTLYKLAQPIYHHYMEIADPVPVPVPPNYTPGPSIVNQTLYAGFQALRVAIGDPHADDLNIIEASLRDPQQPGVSLREHAAAFASKVNDLHRLGRVYDTVRPNETGELFWRTINKKYWRLVQDFLSDNAADHQRTRTAMLAYMLPRAWAFERSDLPGDASQVEEDVEHKILSNDALATRGGPKKTSMVTPRDKVTTTLDISSLNPITLAQLGLKLVPIDQPKPNRPRREFGKPEANTDGYKYCWTHGYYAPHKGHTSEECRNPAEGHKVRATGKAIMGGSTKVTN